MVVIFISFFKFKCEFYFVIILRVYSVFSHMKLPAVTDVQTSVNVHTSVTAQNSDFLELWIIFSFCLTEPVVMEMCVCAVRR